MKSNTEIIEFLQSTLKADNQRRDQLIKHFQNEVWNDETAQDNNLNEILSELAYDFDFYEPNEELREEDTSYYGNDKLEAIIKAAIRKLQ